MQPWIRVLMLLSIGEISTATQLESRNPCRQITFPGRLNITVYPHSTSFAVDISGIDRHFICRPLYEEPKDARKTPTAALPLPVVPSSATIQIPSVAIRLYPECSILLANYDATGEPVKDTSNGVTILPAKLFAAQYAIEGKTANDMSSTTTTTTSAATEAPNTDVAVGELIGLIEHVQDVISGNRHQRPRDKNITTTTPWSSNKTDSALTSMTSSGSSEPVD